MYCFQEKKKKETKYPIVLSFKIEISALVLSSYIIIITVFNLVLALYTLQLVLHITFFSGLKL